MIRLEHSAYRALRNMVRATKRGDIDAAFKWSIMAAAQTAGAKHIRDLEQRRPRRNWRKRRARIAKLAPKTPDKTKPAKLPPPVLKGPVMLDPNGFSPGGTPNWVLNQRRLERAGLPLNHAPPLSKT